jgi:hypothetical protein
MFSPVVQPARPIKDATVRATMALLVMSVSLIRNRKRTAVKKVPAVAGCIAAAVCKQGSRIAAENGKHL